MIEPFFFERGELFGIYHPPVASDSGRLVVVCTPLFEDYKRCYRFQYDLANGCASQGLHVLRFDYYGTGESQGELQDASVPRWIMDIQAAIEEGVALSGADQVVLLAVRFGATLASQVRDVRVIGLVSWDPVLDGKGYIAELEMMNGFLEGQHRDIARYVNEPMERVQYVNFAITQSLREEISRLAIGPESPVPLHNLDVVTTNPASCAEEAFASCLFVGVEYDWTTPQDGLISLKPVLEGLVRKAMNK